MGVRDSNNFSEFQLGEYGPDGRFRTIPSENGYAVEGSSDGVNWHPIQKVDRSTAMEDLQKMMESIKMQGLGIPKDFVSITSTSSGTGALGGLVGAGSIGGQFGPLPLPHRKTLMDMFDHRTWERLTEEIDEAPDAPITDSPGRRAEPPKEDLSPRRVVEL